MTCFQAVRASTSDAWGADLDLLNLPCMPSGRQDFFQRVRQLNRESRCWSSAQMRAFNKIWGHLERMELDAVAPERVAVPVQRP